MEPDDKRFHVFWQSPVTQFCGVLANVSRSQLPDALRSANRWAYGRDVAEQTGWDAYEEAADAAVERLEETDIARFGDVQVAESPADFWEETP
jgi:hypothetical protein